MFRANDTQQITMHDSFLNLPPHIQRLIEKSWAKDFISVKMVERANTLKKFSTDRYRKLARLRNGIECRPSLLRRRLGVDHIPVFGYLASKCFFMVKTGASNLIAFFSYRRRQQAECAIFA